MTTARKALVVAAITVGLALAGCAAPVMTGTPTAATVTAAQAAPNSPVTPVPVRTVIPATPAAPPTPSVTPPAEVGSAQTFKSTNAAGVTGSTGTVTVESVVWSHDSLQTYGEPPTNAYLVIDVSIQTTTGSTDYNPYDWTVRDAQGHTYQPSFMGQEPALHSGTAVAGDLVRGFVTFDVPQGAVTVIMGARPGIRWAVPA